MVIVGLTGDIGSGKTTFAEYLTQATPDSEHFESWELIAEVARLLRMQPVKHPLPTDVGSINQWLKALPGAIYTVTGRKVDHDDISVSDGKIKASPENYEKLLDYLKQIQSNPDLQTGEITNTNKETYRSLLQWLGGYLVMTVSTGIWYDEIIRRIQDKDELNLAVIGGVRFPGDARRVKAAGGRILRIDRPGIDAKDMHDLTERERSLIRYDSNIVNNSTKRDLCALAKKVYTDLQNDRLKGQYFAQQA